MCAARKLATLPSMPRNPTNQEYTYIDTTITKVIPHVTALKMIEVRFTAALTTLSDRTRWTALIRSGLSTHLTEFS
eukprot:1188470-Prorocentrum_minimum.AAC.2